MPPLPNARVGDRLLVKGRVVPFSFWPTKPARRWRALQSLIFSLDPFTTIATSIDKKLNGRPKHEALACLDQSKDFFVTGMEGRIVSARPLVQYYAFMNLVKSLCLYRGTRNSFSFAQHGIAVRPAGADDIDIATLETFATPNRIGQPNNFAEFYQALTGSAYVSNSNLPISQVLPQVVPGHRLWADASGKPERFIAIKDIRYIYDQPSASIWLNIYFSKDDLTRLNVSHQKLAQETLLGGAFREVNCNETLDNAALCCFEQIIQRSCPTGYPSEEIHNLSALIRPYLWSTVASVPPYRRYYVYLSPPAERGSLMPQLLSIYAMSYYLGSITRYRPDLYDKFTKGLYGPRLNDFVTGQNLQFLYLMASEFQGREVTKPSIL